MTVSAFQTSLSGPFTLDKQRTSSPLHRGLPGIPVSPLPRCLLNPHPTDTKNYPLPPLRQIF